MEAEVKSWNRVSCIINSSPPLRQSTSSRFAVQLCRNRGSFFNMNARKALRSSATSAGRSQTGHPTSDPWCRRIHANGCTHAAQAGGQSTCESGNTLRPNGIAVHRSLTSRISAVSVEVVARYCSGASGPGNHDIIVKSSASSTLKHSSTRVRAESASRVHASNPTGESQSAYAKVRGRAYNPSRENAPRDSPDMRGRLRLTERRS